MSKLDTQAKASRKSEILKKARNLFWKKGYSETTIKDISLACRCLPGNIYNYFPNKEAILHEIIIEEMNVLLERVRHLGTDEQASPLEQLREVIGTQLDVILHHVKTNDVLFDTELRHLPRAKKKEIIELRNEYIGIVQNILTRGVKAGVFAKIHVKLVSFYVVGIIVRSRLWYSPSGKMSVAQLADHMFETILNGIAPRN